MKTINASILAIRPGEIELEFPYQSNLTQQYGFIHGGIVSTVLDTACGYAAFYLMPENAAVLTIKFNRFIGGLDVPLIFDTFAIIN